MGAGDIMAILYLLQRPDVQVKAITVAGTGLARCEAGVRHAQGLVVLAGQPDIPVACGRETPLQGSHAFPDDWRDQADALYGLGLSEPDGVATDTAVSLLTTTLQTSPEKTVVLALGPLTNLAEALRSPTPLANHIERIVIMGGAVEARGNVGAAGVGIKNETAEWNMYVDAAAANIVLQAGLPVTLVPLDATNHVPLTTAFYRRLQGSRDTPAAAFVFDLLDHNRNFIESGDYYFWDPLAAALLTNPDLAAYEQATLQVVMEEGSAYGTLQRSDDGSPIQVAVSANGRRFEALFLQTLNAP